MIHKTKYASYCTNQLPEGCKFCVKGRKLVLFITGICSRNCYYCSLSEKRKNKDIVWANKRCCARPEEAIAEAIASRASGAGITGGDPLIVLNRTLKYAKALKSKFGKKFHIHIYLPTKLVTKEKLKKLSKYVDEIRFHPQFLQKDVGDEIEKVKLAGLFWKKSNIGIELPVFPNKVKETFEIIKKASPFIDFVNLNELEISDTNFNYIMKHYKMNKDSYTIRGSKEAGLKILKMCDKTKLNINAHLCTAETKNFYQYQNRIKLREILPYGFRTESGSVRYFAIYGDAKRLMKELRKFKKIYVDYKNKRIIISEKIVPKLIDKYKIARVEELPTWDAVQIEQEDL